MSDFVHATVLLHETVEAVRPRTDGIFVDTTLGGGGHSELLLELSGPDGRLIAVDRDPSALASAKARLARFGGRVTFVHGEMGQLEAILKDLGVEGVDGVIADLGVSSPQLDHAERGFSFSQEGPLDMRMDPTKGETVLDLIARLPDDELANVIYEYGEERKSRPIARSIKQAFEAGELQTTQDLRRAVVRVLGPKKKGRIDPATRTFQGLRIAVNRELDQLETMLAALPAMLKMGGVASIISFHSLEDRLVKHAFRDNPALSSTQRKPIIAGEAEQENNPRARSAKLRVASRVDPNFVEKSPQDGASRYAEKVAKRRARQEQREAKVKKP